MTRTVSLRELDEHLSAVRAAVDLAFDSAEESPTLNFREMGEHLRAALKALGEDVEAEDVHDVIDQAFCRGPRW